MKFSRYLVALFVSVSLLSLLTNAQQPAASTSSPVVPRLVSFSGRAVDSEGKITTGIAGATFAIYPEQFEGTPLWMETQNVQLDARGNYTVQLGATKSQGLPVELFSTGEAHWLGVRINGGEEQPRVLLLSVPYALKAADAETIGGLPPSAFVMATPQVSERAVVAESQSSQKNSSVPASPTKTSEVTTTGGKVNAVPLFTTATNIQNSLLTQNGTSVLNVGGKLNFPATGTATSSAGKVSHPATMVASSFSSGSNTAVNQTFQLQAEPAGNDTAFPSGTLNLLYGSGSGTPGETGLTMTSGGGITASVVGIGTSTPATSLDVFSITTGDHAPISRFGSNGTSDCNSITTYTGSGTTEMFSAEPDCFVPGAAAGDGGVRVKAGTKIILGDASTARLTLDSAGNAAQPLAAGGIAKATVFVNPEETGIVNCFNSTLSGAAATTAPCGFTFKRLSQGDYTIDFGFKVDNRFISATQSDSILVIGVCTDTVAFGCQDSLTASKAEIDITSIVNEEPDDSSFWLLVY